MPIKWWAKVAPFRAEPIFEPEPLRAPCFVCTDVLGNGYTTLFFKGTHAMADLDRALQAYQQAVRPPLKIINYQNHYHHHAFHEIQRRALLAANGGYAPGAVFFTHGD